MTASAAVEHRVTLADGRLVSYAESGDPEGVPVVHAHGVLGCRLEIAAPAIDLAARRLGVRLLAPDRPGIGLSDPKPGRSVLDWPVDLLGFAEAVGISRFSLIGWGGASPFVLASALRIAHRLRAVGIVSGVASPDRAVVTGGGAGEGLRRLSARYAPWWLRRWVRAVSSAMVSDPDRTIDRLLGSIDEADRAVVRDADWREHHRAVLREAFRRGPEGATEDLLAVYRDWGFQPSQVPMVVNLWFGPAGTAGGGAGLWLSRALERSEARVSGHGGSHSFLANRYEELLHGLLVTADREEGRPVG
ncbi:MAG: alpha/beta hydrolase [Gemmatimonadales bacterium]|nr:alpha/beta hydrolase [Gemmatimonadales bacterium]